jgi:hypothetical protein
VLGAAHGIADYAGEGLSFVGGKSGHNDYYRAQHQRR